jgi:hypothetical protein
LTHGMRRWIGEIGWAGYSESGGEARPVRARAVPLLPAWKLANSMQWVLCWEDLD